MKSIDTLVEDIYHLLQEDTDHEVVEPSGYANELSYSLKRALSSREPRTDRSYLYASELGDECPRRVWYKVNRPSEGEPLLPHTRFKFLYGDILEAAILALCKEAGHDVSDEQAVVIGQDDQGRRLVSGRMDAVIDGHTVDVKSMSTFAFNKYKQMGGLCAANDSFGYRYQLAYYHWNNVAEGYDPNKEPYILAVDKQNGHIALFKVLDLPTKEELEARINTQTYAIHSDTIPDRGYSPVPEGKSGNLKIPMPCSYCAFKFQCWPDLRGFAYSNGPVYLTHVAKLPKVPEITLEVAGEEEDTAQSTT